MGTALAQTHLNIEVPSRVASDLHGPVESIRNSYQKEYYNGSGISTSSWKRAKTYDRPGNLLSSTYTNLTKETFENILYDYSTNGCLTGRTVETSKTNTTYSYTIDIDARQILRQDLDSGHIKVTAYNPSGHYIYIEEQDESNTVTKIVKVLRRPDNKEYEYRTFDGDLNPTSTFFYKWNTHGLLREYTYQTYGTNQYTYIAKYSHPKKDRHGNWTRRIVRKYLINKNKKKLSSEETAERDIKYFAPDDSGPPD